jgi:hypothetical protein
MMELSSTIRLYHEPSLMEWMSSNLTVLNGGGGYEKQGRAID